MHVAEHGSGPAVVLIGGCPTPASMWDPVVHTLAKAHRVLVPDLPGYGKTPRLVPYSLAAVQRMLEDALLERGVTDAALVGYSMGAYRALTLALSARVRPTALIWLAGSIQWSEMERAVMGGFVQLLRSPTPLPDILPARMIAPQFLEAHPDSADQVRRWLDAAPREVMADEIEAGLRECEDLSPRLRTLECPVLARVGELDQASPPEHSRLVAENARHGTFQLVPGMGHAWAVEDPVGTSAAIARFLG